MKHQQARQILTEEIEDRPVSLSLAGQAMAEAERALLPFTSSRWIVPAGTWQETVVALAMAVRRMECYRPAPAARVAIRIAVEELRRGGEGRRGRGTDRSSQPADPGPARSPDLRGRESSL